MKTSKREWEHSYLFLSSRRTSKRTLFSLFFRQVKRKYNRKPKWKRRKGHKMLRAITIIIVIIISSVWVLSPFRFHFREKGIVLISLSTSLCGSLTQRIHRGAGHRTWSRHYFLFPLVPLSLLASLPKDTASHHHHHRHQNQQKYCIPNYLKSKYVYYIFYLCIFIGSISSPPQIFTFSHSIFTIIASSTNSTKPEPTTFFSCDSTNIA